MDISRPLVLHPVAVPASCPIEVDLHLADADAVPCCSVAEVRHSTRPAWEVCVTAGAAGAELRLSVRLAFASAGTEPWFLLPGFFYGQGRTDGRLAYPALGVDDVSSWSSSWWDFAMDRMAYPVALALTDRGWIGLDAQPHFTVLDAQGRATLAGPAVWGDSEPQVGFGLSWKDGVGNVRVNVPGNEGPRRHARNRHDGPTDKRVRLGAGESLRLRVGLWENASTDRHGYQPILEELYAELHPLHPPAQPAPANELATAAADGLLDWHIARSDPPYIVYTAAYDRSAEFNANLRRTSLSWHFEAIGFVGGFSVAYALLWQARRSGQRAEEIERLVDQLAGRWCREAVAPCGLLRTSYHPGRSWTPNGRFANPAGTGSVNQDATGDTPFYGACWQPDQNHLHARSTADASYYLARLLRLVGTRHAMYGAWREVLRGSLAAAMGFQGPDGRFGQIYDVGPAGGRVHQWEGAGGLLWIPAMLEAEPLFADDADFAVRLAQSALRGGAGYAADVEAEYICGAPEDVSLTPTSEDGYNAMLAYGGLHRRFGRGEHAALLRRAADWTLSWRKACNVRFSPRTMLAQADFRTCGGDFASSNNNHLHVYGMNCLAELYRLSAETGNGYYARRAHDNFCFTCQMLSLEAGQFNGQRGMLSEQFYSNDWSIWGGWDPTSAHVQKGTLMGFSHAWCIAMVLLGLEQLEQAGVLASGPAA